MSGCDELEMELRRAALATNPKEDGLSSPLAESMRRRWSEE